MKNLSTPINLLTTISMITVLCTSCGGGRVAQCNRMTTVGNKAVELSKALTKSVQAQTNADALIAEYGNAASNFDQMSKEMQGLEVNDAKLKVFRLRFVDMYQDTKSSLDKITGAIKTKNENLVYQAIEESKLIAEREKTLVTEVNAYCSGR
jgi:predicted nuclease with TOPRIM domain